MAKGVVKWFDDSKGYGFITGEDGRDVFVAHSAIVKSLAEGDNVTYDLEESPRFPMAVKVRREKA